MAFPALASYANPQRRPGTVILDRRGRPVMTARGGLQNAAADSAAAMGGGSAREALADYERRQDDAGLDARRQAGQAYQGGASSPFAGVGDALSGAARKYGDFREGVKGRIGEWLGSEGPEIGARGDSAQLTGSPSENAHAILKRGQKSWPYPGAWKEALESLGHTPDMAGYQEWASKTGSRPGESAPAPQRPTAAQTAPAAAPVPASGGAFGAAPTQAVNARSGNLARQAATPSRRPPLPGQKPARNAPQPQGALSNFAGSGNFRGAQDEGIGALGQYGAREGQGEAGGGAFGMDRNAALALMAAGLGTMSSASRPGATALGAIGEGGLGGLGMYDRLERRGALREERQLDRDERANRPYSAMAQLEADRRRGLISDADFKRQRDLALRGKGAAPKLTTTADGTLASINMDTGRATPIKGEDGEPIKAMMKGGDSTAYIKNVQWNMTNLDMTAKEAATFEKNAKDNPRKTLMKLYADTINEERKWRDPAEAKQIADDTIAAVIKRFQVQGVTGGSQSGSKAAKPQGMTDTQALEQARQAIQQGAPRDAVERRMREWGIDPGRL